MLCYNMVKLSERRVIMIQTTVQVSGMACSMCEAHVNDAVRSALNVKKVTSSHVKGETVILSDEPLDEGKLRETINATGYQVGGISSAPYEKKGLFSFLHKETPYWKSRQRKPLSALSINSSC